MLLDLVMLPAISSLKTRMTIRYYYILHADARQCRYMYSVSSYCWKSGNSIDVRERR